MKLSVLFPRIAIITGCGLIMTMATGCDHWIELTTVPTYSEKLSSHFLPLNEQVPLAMDIVKITRNGSPQNVSLETEQRILNSLAQIGLFSQIQRTTSSTSIFNGKVVHARLQFDEAIEPHAGDAAWKGILIGASMFTLAPFIELEYNYAANLTLELERWDGKIKRYASQSSGTTRYHLFGATPIMIDELKGHVTESCLRTLAHQLVRDTQFYTENSTVVINRRLDRLLIKPHVSETSTSIPTFGQNLHPDETGP